MAVVTYATKAGGLWAMGKVDLSETVTHWLEAIPGAVIVAIVAPAVVTGGPPEWLATAAVLLLAWKSGSILLAMTVGIAIVWAVRHGPPVL